MRGVGNVKKIGYSAVLVFGLFICLFPLAGMTFARTDETTEKKELASFPAVKEDNHWNESFLQELGAYFEDHFAFRQKFVAMDSWIESILFQKSNIDNVIVGKDGWLFYKDTLNDYTGKEVLSDRSLENIAYNLSVMQGQVESQDKHFVFTIAPNKNSLYPQGMPYTYSYKYSNTNNRKLLEEKLKKASVNYVDLYQQFTAENETLYLKRDSHWNNKGALLAYNCLLDGADWPHEDYADCQYQIKKDYIGDLNSMVYPELEQPEENYYYDFKTLYQYVNRGKYEDAEQSTISVEDARIQTYNTSCKGNLVMYRDSFGNTLLPFMANAFENGYFFKTEPYNLGMHIESYNPDVVIVEKVERKLDDLAFTPAIMTGKEITLPDKYRTVETNTTLSATIPEGNTSYYEIYGVLDETMASSSDAIYVQYKMENGNTVTYQAFAKTIPKVSDYGYVSYIPGNFITDKTMEVNVFIERKDGIFCIKSSQIEVSSIQSNTDTITKKELPVTKSTNDNEIEITIMEKGTKKVLRTHATTLQEMETLGEITLNDEDRIIPDRNETLVNGEVVSIQRVVIKTKKVVKKLPFKTKEVLSDTMYEGESAVTTKGKKGEKTIIYHITYVDGKIEKKEKISEKVTKKPITKVISKGTKQKIIPTQKPKPQPQPKKNTNSSNTPNNKTVISKEWVEDCGSDSGYYIITYSDGSVEYVDG